MERKKKFATNKQKQAEAEATASLLTTPSANKRGAPVGHPGWFRPTATQYDWEVNVPAPRRCPGCLGPVDELFKVTFTPAALLGFEETMAEKSEPLVDDIAKKLGSSDGAVHADETYWTLDGDGAYFWVHADEAYVRRTSCLNAREASLRVDLSACAAIHCRTAFSLA